jgi:uncharacterized protein YecE (DUF72 family)
MAKLRIGTCSWKFASWEGLVYSAPRDINYLEEYAQKYNTVEIDQWFWSLFGEERSHVRLPNPFTVEDYRASVADDFRFTVKAPNSLTLTHFYRDKKSDPLVPNPYFLSPDLTGEFLELLEPLRDTLGPIMFQFGYLNKQMMDSQEQFQELLATFINQIPPDYAYALETRNSQYLNAAFFEFLNRNGIIPVFLQGYWMPSIVEIYEQWRSLIVHQVTVVIRLHGPDRQGIEKLTGKEWDQVVAAKDDELRSIADMVKDLLSEGINVYLNVNNHYEGSAPLTIARIEQLL